MHFVFTPVDVEDIIGNVELTVGQVSKLGGVSARQVEYWTQKGMIMPKNPSDTVKRYSIETVIKIRLINQCLNIGMTLDSADRTVKNYMNLYGGKGAEGDDAQASDRLVYSHLSESGSVGVRDEGGCMRIKDEPGEWIGGYFGARKGTYEFESEINDLKDRLSLIEKRVDRLSASVDMVNSIQSGGNAVG